MAETQKQMSKKETILVNLSNFLNRNRRFFIIFLAVIILGLISFAVAREIISKRKENAAGLAETSQQLYHEWVTAVEEEKDTEDKKIELQKSLDKIHEEYPKFFAAARAFFIEGNMLFEEEEWVEAAEKYVTIADNFPETYLAPIGLNNASVAYENAEDFDQAIGVLVRLREEYQEEYPDMPRILFNLGRLYEAEEEFENAEETYNNLIDNFPEGNWTKLARNRIIQMTID